MKTVSLSGASREHVGKKDAKKHRKEGKIPCVLYGGEKQIHFTTDEKAFGKIIFTPEVYLINLNIDGKECHAILQDIQYHPVTDVVLHADFLEIVDGKPVTVAIPVKFEGKSPGVVQGGKLIKKMRKLTVRGLVSDIPEDILVNISKLKIGDSIRVRDMEIEKLSFTDPASAQIVGVRTARTVLAEDEEDEEGGEAAEGEGGEAAAEGAES